jgi:hypothetical protein
MFGLKIQKASGNPGHFNRRRLAKFVAEAVSLSKAAAVQAEASSEKAQRGPEEGDRQEGQKIGCQGINPFS